MFQPYRIALAMRTPIVPGKFPLHLAITVAIAIHNIPEGIAVAVPIYHSTGSRKKPLAFLAS